MKQVLSIFLVLIGVLPLQAQRFAVGNDKFNIAYIGLDNPISIAVENCPCSDIVLKVNNGTITGSGCQYIYRGKETGSDRIKIYKKAGGKLKEVGQYAFRVKQIPPPVFKIGPYGVGFLYAERKVRAVVLGSMEYVRADIEGFDFDARCRVDSFKVKIFHADSGKISSFFNLTNTINQQIRDAFVNLHSCDVIYFYKIFAKGPDDLQWELDPLILTIDQ